MKVIKQDEKPDVQKFNSKTRSSTFQAIMNAFSGLIIFKDFTDKYHCLVKRFTILSKIESSSTSASLIT
jgi:hypothetical protein